MFVEAAIGQSQIMVGRIDYSTGTPRLLDKTLAVDKRDVGHDAKVEAQDSSTATASSSSAAMPTKAVRS